jgi:hypothetical protein
MTENRTEHRDIPTFSNLVCTECNHQMSIIHIKPDNINTIIVDNMEHTYITCPSCQSDLHFVDNVYVETTDEHNRVLTLSGVYGLVSPRTQ